MQYIGKLNKATLGIYAKKILTDDVVLTNERKLHILENHKNDYIEIIEHISNVVLNPCEILEDFKNVDTLFLIGNLEKNHLNVVIKLNTTTNRKHPMNSIMTAWIVRDRNLRKLRQKNKTIYKHE